MNGKKKRNKKILVGAIAVLALGLIVFFSFGDKTQDINLSCEQLESNDQAKLTTKILINKKSKKIHLNYTGTIEFLVDNDFAQNAMSIFVKKQVSTLDELDDVVSNFNETENKITYEFDFDFNSSIENEIKDLIGIYSTDIEELKKHFESGGAVCAEI